MPELPEVETVVRSVAPHLAGRKILSAEFNSRHVTPGNRAKLAEKLAGRTIRDTRRRGKFIVITLDEGMLSIHLGMTGKLLLDAPRTDYTHGVFTLDHGTLLYDDPRQFGKIEWSPKRIDKLGPEPLEIGLEEFTKRLRSRKSRVKPLLMNQSFLAGLGNIYVDEALFAAGIHPLAMASRISAPRAAKLHQAIQETLRLAIEHRGSSISDYVDAEGRRGYFQVMHRVYGREDEPCLKCATAIKKIVVGQRGTHFCPECQKR
ncbi:MAG: bifunctional DNA-formamidopyrimidine glycosylase/DNA-(apurinic or apyrimidinic site) lyase [Acidobacteriia bacterium]|nr:bifunctional DNA-formamidopyrimidine glycosylase/DNA-(apurinic or apyrimidinic site) lyase [Terriglobia bacterium]